MVAQSNRKISLFDAGVIQFRQAHVLHRRLTNTSPLYRKKETF